MLRASDSALARRLVEIIDAAGMRDILRAIRDERLPDWWLAGGAVRNTVWRALFPKDCTLGIKDFDIAFFEADSGREREQAAKANLSQRFPDQQFDVKNQASFGVWREWHFQFDSTEDGISHWLHTATAVGVRVNADDEMEIFAPYGLDDLFNGIIRPTPYVAGSQASADKGAEFLKKCPSLREAETGK